MYNMFYDFIVFNVKPFDKIIFCSIQDIYQNLLPELFKTITNNRFEHIFVIQSSIASISSYFGRLQVLKEKQIYIDFNFQFFFHADSSKLPMGFKFL